MKKIKKFFVWLFTPVEGVPMDPYATQYYNLCYMI